MMLTLGLVALCCGMFSGAALAAGEEPQLPIKERSAPAASVNAPPHTIPGVDGAALPPNSSQCPSLYFCMWEKPNYEGAVWSRNGFTETWDYVGNFNDSADSIWNRRNNSSWVDKDWPAAGDYVCIGSGWSYPTLAGEYWWQNGNKAEYSISSYWLASTNYNNCEGQPQFY
jgi:hypothetical protein